ncbi:MAG: cation:proton antiporter [Gammaproteobacteria bacterium]|nr:cation:proton antiporter [Gammaproteobacteria bacterium]
MDAQQIVFLLFIIFSGAAVLSTVALFTRQSLLVAYMALGIILGPWCADVVREPERIAAIGDVGIIFLLFLLGLHLHPQNLWGMLKKVSWIALVSSLAFGLLGFVTMLLFKYTIMEAFVTGIAMMFSSTIIGLKLLPTTVLHHQHTGELMISILLMQDIIAIVALLVLQACAGSAASDVSAWVDFGIIAISFPLLIVIAYLFQRFFLVRLLERFDTVQEYIFLISVGWCLAMAELAHVMKLSPQIGAFIAGVAIAAHPISLYIAESLKPLRDFFLVLFFFAIGASFNVGSLMMTAIPAIVLSVIALVAKPYIFSWLFRQAHESKAVSFEVGVRMGQISEFSLLVGYVAASSKLISMEVSSLIQAATMITFVISCYWVVIKYPTPLALTEKLRKD